MKTINQIGTLTDKYGDPIIIHKTRHGLRRLRANESAVIAANRIIGRLISKRIKSLRIARGWTLLETATKLGWLTGNPKERVWAIENQNSRNEGMRLGTIFRIAEVFDVELSDIIPSKEEISLELLAAKP